MISPTPSEIQGHIEKLLSKLNAEFEPEIVPIIPEPYAKYEQCFNNVAEKVKRDGGSVHYGWAVFLSQIICEGERHAVWESPEGELLDITPRDPEVDRIMFISDNNLVYKGQIIDNVRINITNNRLVDDYILFSESIERLYTYGRRMNEDQIALPEPLLKIQLRFFEDREKVLEWLRNGYTHESPCSCGNSLSYENCCRPNLKLEITECFREIDKVFTERPLKG